MSNEKKDNENKNECGSEKCIDCLNVYRCTKQEMSQDAKSWNLARLGRRL